MRPAENWSMKCSESISVRIITEDCVTAENETKGEICMTKKENFLAVCRGEKPEYIPSYEDACQYLSPEALQDPFYKLYELHLEYKNKGIEKMPEWEDAFGIPFVLDDFGPIVKPGFTLMDDVSQWREKYKIPDLSGYDWDAACERDAAALDPDKAVELALIGVFGHLSYAMGYVPAMMTFADQDAEEDVFAMFDALTDFHVEVIENVMKRIHVDMFQMGDDFASSASMLISPEAYRKFVKPYHRKLYEAARRMNPDIILEQHTCGHCEAVMGDIKELGVQVWQPAQQMNDLHKIQDEYGIVLNGVWDNVSICAAEEDALTEEDVKQSVRACIDEYGKNGRFIFWDGGPMGESQKIVTRLAWANEEVMSYGADFYRR